MKNTDILLLGDAVTQIKTTLYEVKQRQLENFIRFGFLSANRCLVNVFEDNDNGSDFSKLCEVAKVEVNLTPAVNEEIEYFNLGENQDSIACHESNNKESKK